MRVLRFLLLALTLTGCVRGRARQRTSGLEELFGQCMRDDPLTCDIDGIRLARTGLNTPAIYGAMVMVSGAVVLLATCAGGGLGCEGDAQH